MTPMECASAFWELSRRQLTNREIVALYGRTEGYISYMVRTGEALAELHAEERRRLNRDDRLRVRDCQTIAALPSVAERVQALRTLLADGSVVDSESTAAPGADKTGQGRAVRSSRQRPDEQDPFLGRSLRNQGRSFRVRWRDDDLRTSPQAFVDALTQFLDTELQALLERLDTLKDEFQQAGDHHRVGEIELARTEILARKNAPR